MVDSTRADLKERLGNLKSGMLTTISNADLTYLFHAFRTPGVS